MVQQVEKTKQELCDQLVGWLVEEMTYINPLMPLACLRHGKFIGMELHCNGHTHPASLVGFHPPKETNGICPMMEMEYEERNPTCSADLNHRWPKHTTQLTNTIQYIKTIYSFSIICLTIFSIILAEVIPLC